MFNKQKKKFVEFMSDVLDEILDLNNPEDDANLSGREKKKIVIGRSINIFNNTYPILSKIIPIKYKKYIADYVIDIYFGATTDFKYTDTDENARMRIARNIKTIIEKINTYRKELSNTEKLKVAIKEVETFFSAELPSFLWSFLIEVFIEFIYQKIVKEK